MGVQVVRDESPRDRGGPRLMREPNADKLAAKTLGVHADPGRVLTRASRGRPVLRALVAQNRVRLAKRVEGGLQVIGV